MHKRECFKDIKNLLNYKTFNKLVNALKENKRIDFFRIVNGCKYIYSTKWLNNRKGIVIRNITKWPCIALLIDSEAIKEYNQFILEV